MNRQGAKSAKGLPQCKVGVEHLDHNAKAKACAESDFATDMTIARFDLR